MNYNLLHKIRCLPILLLAVFAFISDGVKAQCAFTYSPLVACEGNPVNFFAPAGSSNEQWDLGNGTSTQKNPAQIYNSAGTYTITLIAVVNGSPCTSSVNIEVKPKPVVKLALISPPVQCYKGNQFCFRDSSDGGAGSSIVGITGVFTADAQVIQQANPSKPFQFCYTFAGGNTGQTTINLIYEVTDANGCITKINNVYTLGVYGDMGLKFTTNAPIACDSTLATFTNQSKADSTDLAYWKWDFGDGDSLVNSHWKPGPLHWYRKHGTFNGKLTVVSKDGCTDVFTFSGAATNVVLRPKIVPDFDSVCFAAPTIQFSVTGVPALTFTPDSIIWNFGDPPTGQLNFAFQKYSAPHAFSSPKRFIVSVRIKKAPCDITVRDTIWIIGPQSMIEEPPAGVIIAAHERYQCKIRDSVHFPNRSKFYRNDWDFNNEDGDHIVIDTIKFNPVTQKWDTTFLTVSPKTNRRDNAYRIWDLGDDYADRCTTDTRAGLNIGRNCRFTLDSLPVHWYTPWDSIYVYQRSRQPLLTTVFDTASSTCQQRAVFAADSAIIVVDTVILVPPGQEAAVAAAAGSRYRIQVLPKTEETGYQRLLMATQGKFRICNGDTLKNWSKNILHIAPTSGCITVKIPKGDFIEISPTSTATYLVDTIIRKDTIAKNFRAQLIPPGDEYRLDSVPINMMFPNLKKLNMVPIASNSNPNVIIDAAWHRKLFFQNTVQCITVTLFHKDTAHAAPRNCEHSDRITLALGPPNAVGLTEEGIKCFAPPSPPYGVIFKLDGTKPGCSQEFIRVNFDSLGGIGNPNAWVPQTGLNPPPLPGVNPWPPAPGPYPNRFVKPYTSSQVADKKKGWVTVGLIIEQGIQQAARYGTQVCKDTQWYHRFLRFLFMESAFNVYNPAKNDKTICKYGTIWVRTLFPEQDSNTSTLWNWGDGYYNAEYPHRYVKHPTDPTKLYNYLERMYIDGNTGDTLSYDTIWTAIIHKYSIRADFTRAEAALSAAFKSLGLNLLDIPPSEVPKYFRNPAGTKGCIDTTGLGSLITFGYFPDSMTVIHKRDSSITDTISHQYRTVGRYVMNLTLFNTSGCIKRSQQEIDVGFYSKLFTIDTITCKNTPIVFRDSVLYWAYESITQVTDPYEYWHDVDRIINNRETLKWDMDTADKTVQFNINGPDYTYNSGYPNPGRYVAALAMKDSLGCRDTIYQPIYVSGVKAGFKPTLARPQCTAILTFTDTSVVYDPCSASLGVPCDSIIFREWDFGDGKPKSTGESNLKFVGHDYTSNDTFYVKLRVKTLLGCEDSVSFELIIPGPKPKFDPFTDTVICKGNKVWFRNISRNVTPTSQWIWYFGDGTTYATNKDTTVSHTYSTPGTYYVYLAMSDYIPNTTQFCTFYYPDTTNQVNDVRLHVRVLDFNEATFTASDTVVCPRELVNFDATGTSSTYTSFQWDFGDGDTLTTDSMKVSHAYKKEGYYRVIMTPNYTPPAGDVKCSDADTLWIRVVKVKADFDIDKVNSPEFKFNNTSQDAVSYEWYFHGVDSNATGFQLESTQKDPTYLYLMDSAAFWVCLIATSAENCKDTQCRVVDFNYVTAIKPFNVFSPNGDGKNDVFDIDITGEIKYNLVIFNRWGEKVFESTNSQTDWNGKTFNDGAECPTGTYFYTLTYQFKGREEASINGTVTLIRKP